MKYEFQVRMQQRHLKAIVGALKFRQRFLSGDVYGTLGRAAMVYGTLGRAAMYGPWFTHRTKSLYDIYSVIQHEEGEWRYSAVCPLVPGVPLMEISRCI